jgi:Zinc finger, C3HC4 type (RING finger)
MISRLCPICWKEPFRQQHPYLEGGEEDTGNVDSDGEIFVDLETGLDRSMVLISCGHSLCHDCLLQSIKTQVQERTTKTPVCPMAQCNEVLQTDWIIDNILHGPTTVVNQKPNHSDGSEQQKDVQELLDKLLRIDQWSQVGQGIEMVECVRCQDIFPSKSMSTSRSATSVFQASGKWRSTQRCTMSSF